MHRWPVIDVPRQPVVREVELLLPLRDLPPLGEAESDERLKRERLEYLSNIPGTSVQEARSAEVDHFGALHTLRYVRDHEGSQLPETWSALVQVIELGPIRIIGLPVEFFVASSNDIRRAQTGPDPVVISYANDLLGYAPPLPDFASGGYETTVTLLGPGAAELLVGAAVDLLRRPLERTRG
jgi:hypothetical protein